MAIHSIEAKSVLQKSGLPGTRYVINPYTGCVHGCVYCYARFMKRFTAHREPWGTFLDAKTNAAQVLKKQLDSRRKPLDERVFFSSVTDPYQPPEKRCRLTRSLLEVLLDHQVPVSILTKSDLVLRDLDLLRRIPGATVGLSFSTMDDRLARILEPRASPPSRRIHALRELQAAGIDTWAFLSPFLPGVSDLDAQVVALEGAVGEFGVEAINTRGGNWAGVEKALAGIDPALPGRCKSLSRDAVFWKELEQHARRLARKHRMKLIGFYRHGAG
jgi:DNA repair photolyase